MKLNRKSLPLLLIATSLLIFLNAERISAASTGPQTSGAIHYVKPGEAGDCSSWVSACELQAALALAQAGDQVWVAAGTYYPTADTDRTATFQLESGVAIYGGFAGTETSLTERDWETNITTLSGDIGTTDDSADNSYHVVTGSGVDVSAILDGFTITAGNANGASSLINSGGGMYNLAGSPTVSHVIFSANSAAYYGGGMFNDTSSPKLTHVTFISNIANFYGGGMGNHYSNPTLSKVVFNGNSVTTYGGGGMYNFISSPILTNVIFNANTAISSGGGMTNDGLDNTSNCSSILTYVVFSANSANRGGGMHNNYCSAFLTNVTFSDNSAANSGGGMNNQYKTVSLTNVTFKNNSAGDGGEGGGIRNHLAALTITNSIVWGNTPSGIYHVGSAANITYSDIQGGYEGTGNIDTDPLLGNLADNGGFSQTNALGVGSPAIDTGNPNNCPSTDQRGYYRPIDGDENGSAICDMGAYEYGSALFFYLPLIVRD